jgi:hypothetical protein
VPAARRKAFFAYFLLPFGQKVRRLAGRDPPVLPVLRIGLKTETLTSPVPAGSRVAFFARPKKVTKERTFAWRRALLSREISVLATDGEDNKCGASWRGSNGLFSISLAPVVSMIRDFLGRWVKGRQMAVSRQLLPRQGGVIKGREHYALLKL